MVSEGIHLSHSFGRGVDVLEVLSCSELVWLYSPRSMFYSEHGLQPGCIALVRVPSISCKVSFVIMCKCMVSRPTIAHCLVVLCCVVPCETSVVCCLSTTSLHCVVAFAQGEL